MARAAHTSLLLLLWIVACTGMAERRLDQRYGEAVVRDRTRAATPADEVDYTTDVRPIFETRCVVCHACFDASCRLDLGSPEGIDRGLAEDGVYDGTRLLATEPTRLFEDAKTTAQWRERGFRAVLNERRQTSRANTEASMLHRSIDLGRRHPVAPGGMLADDVETGLNREQECPSGGEYRRFARKHQGWGMPFAMPPLDDREHDVIKRWLAQGAKHTPPPPLSRALQMQVDTWETFLNDDSLKQQLASRYIYEHLFYAHVYFPGDRTRQYFDLVRSKTPPGQPVDRIATRRPYDDPGVERPYYRLEPVNEAIVAKMHLPYRLNAARMKRWRQLFIAPEYAVEALPAYTPEVASNPFAAFAAIPADSRYRFMLDEAEFIIMGFIKGPVCRGPVALNVIEDRFWVFFVDPDVRMQLHDTAFLKKHADTLRMPAEASSTALPLATWIRQSLDEERFAGVKQKALREDFADRPVTLDMLWDGDGDNRNAALTVFRHHESASVVKGMVGEGPETAWVLDYPTFERIHYLLVAGFDVFGNVGHQLATRTYMDFLRMESELTFLHLLPPDDRARERASWYRGTEERAYGDIIARLTVTGVETGLRFETADPKRELYGMIAKHLAPILEPRWRIDSKAIPEDIAGPLAELPTIPGTALTHLPQTIFLLVPDAPDDAQVFTITRDNSHTNIASPFLESRRRVPAEDRLTVAAGFIGTYPNVFWVVTRDELPRLVERVRGLRTADDYATLQATHAVRRTDSEFWLVSDRLAEIFADAWPIEAGLFDLSRYERPAKAPKRAD